MAQHGIPKEEVQETSRGEKKSKSNQESTKRQEGGRVKGTQGPDGR